LLFHAIVRVSLDCGMGAGMPEEQVTRRRFGFEFIETPDDVDFRMSRGARIVLIALAIFTVVALVVVLAVLALTGQLGILTRKG
jgi:hypothetical protein